VDEADNALAVWRRYDQDVSILEASYRPAGRHRWQPAVRLPSIPSAQPLAFRLSVAPDGSAVVAALDLVGTGSTATEGVEAIVGSSGTWQSPTLLTSYRKGGYEVSAAAEPQGRGIVVWDEDISGNDVVRSASYAPGTGWGTPVNLSFRDGQACCAVVTADSQGGAVSVWNATVDVEASTRSASGQWSRPVALSPPLHPGTIGVASNASGQAVAGWEGASADFTQDVIQAAAFLPDSGWQPATTLSNAQRCCASPSTALDAAGDAAVVWQNDEGTAQDGAELYSVRAALLDAGGPLLHAVYALKPPAIVGTARAGRTLTCRPGAWSGDPPITFRYQWLRSGYPAGSKPRIRLGARDVGASFQCRLTAANPLGTATSSSAAVTVRR
jgi:hypothetical protein